MLIYWTLLILMGDIMAKPNSMDDLRKLLNKIDFEKMQDEEADEFQRYERPGKIGKGAGKLDGIDNLADLRKAIEQALANPLEARRVDHQINTERILGSESQRRSIEDYRRNQDPAKKKGRKPDSVEESTMAQPKNLDEAKVMMAKALAEREALENLDMGTDPAVNLPESASLANGMADLKMFDEENMENTPTVIDRAFEDIVKEEGPGGEFSERAFFPNNQERAGINGNEPVPTIGYGTLLNTENFTEDELDFYINQKGKITEPQAKAKAKAFIKNKKEALEEFTGKELNEFMDDEQIKEVLDYTFNVGFDPSWKFSKNLKAMAEAEDKETRDDYARLAAKEMDIVTSGGVLQRGLVKRREKNRRNFLKGVKPEKSFADRMKDRISQAEELASREIPEAVAPPEVDPFS